MSGNSNYNVDCHTCFTSKSRVGLISVMLGMTVCFSTLWRFPYQVANFGGAAFVLIYIILAALFVYPALTAEWGLGRFTGKGLEEAYSKVKLPGGKYIAALLFGIVIMIGSYFVIWIGWILRYVFSSLTDSSLINPATNSNSYFDTNVAANAPIQLIFAVLVILLITPTLLGGTKIIEKISKAIVPLFYVLTVIITVLILSQPRVFSGTISFLTNIDIASQVNSFTFLAALGQAFFSLCLGGTYMVLYASYMERKPTHNIPGNAILTIIGNTLASLIAVFLVIGVVIMSGISTTNNLASFGPGLFFGVIPEAFQQISLTLGGPLASLLMTLFFVMFFFAAYLPMAAIITVTSTALERKYNIKRKFSFAIISIATLLLAIPSALSPLDGGFLYNLDIFVGAIGSVFGSIIAMIAFAWFVDKKTALQEINFGSRIKMGNLYYFTIKYLAPLFMSLVVLYALADVLINSQYVLYKSIITVTPILVIFFVCFIGVIGITQTLSNRTRVKA
ncbi:MAG: sodium-dependent transporter [Candidatus Thorarchaeota archaeon]